LRIASAEFLFVVGALILLALGYLLAPEPTLDCVLLSLPAACVLLAAVVIGLGTLQTRWPGTRRVALQVGLTVPLLVAAAGAVRAVRATHAASAHAEALAEFEATAPPIAQVEDMRRVYFNVFKDMHDHDYVFIRNVLWIITAWSVLAFVALQLLRARALWHHRS